MGAGGYPVMARRRWRGPLAGLGALALALAGVSAPGAVASEPYGAISGKVSEAVTMKELAGIDVCAVSRNFELLNEEESEHSIGCATTGAGGEYTIGELRPESYDVVFFVPLAGSLNYIAQIWDGKAGNPKPPRSRSRRA